MFVNRAYFKHLKRFGRFPKFQDSQEKNKVQTTQNVVFRDLENQIFYLRYNRAFYFNFRAEPKACGLI
jgi:hypothetical protein